MLWLAGDVVRFMSSAFVRQVCSFTVVGPMTSMGFTVPGGGCAGGAGGGDVGGKPMPPRSRARSPSLDEPDERDDRERTLVGGSSSVGDSEMPSAVIGSPGWAVEAFVVLEVVARRSIESRNEAALSLLDDRPERLARLSSPSLMPKASVGLSVL